MKIHDSQHCLPQPFATGPQSSEPGTSFDPFQLELPWMPPRSLPVEWQSPVAVLTDYLRAIGVTQPGLAARSLLDEFGSLSDLLAASSSRLRRVAGKRLADVLRASRILIEARFSEQIREGPIVPRSPELIKLLQLEVGFLDHERLVALYVDSNRRLMRIQKVGDGTLGGATINSRKIIGCGLALGASGFILVHNHPSGNPAPSKADLAATAHLRRLGAEVELFLLDHLIVARGQVEAIEDLWREARWNGAETV